MHKSKFWKSMLLVGVLCMATPAWADVKSAQQTAEISEEGDLEKDYEAFEETKDQILISAALDEKDEDICHISAAVPNMPGDVEKVTFHLIQRDQKDDKGKWYKGKKKSQEIFQISLDETELKTDVAYEVKAYAKKEDKSSIYLGKTAFLISEEEVALKREDEKENEKEEKSEASVSVNGQSALVDDATNNELGYYTIMGNSTATVEQMVKEYNSQSVEYPSEALESGGAATIEEFCEILYEECEKEGVRAEVAFAQSMLETGWLQFRGDSQVEQFNFAGLGTTGGGVKGIYFPDVQTGLRAQVQHLKAYASSDKLNEECVDERFDLVTRETAPYVEWLGIQENPYGGGWAAGADYGAKLLRIISDLKAIK